MGGGGGGHTHIGRFCSNHESMLESLPAVTISLKGGGGGSSAPFSLATRPKLYILLSQYRGRGTSYKLHWIKYFDKQKKKKRGGGGSRPNSTRKISQNFAQMSTEYCPN